MSRVDISSAGFSRSSLPNGMLQTDNALSTTLQTVKDNLGNSSTLLLSTVDAQVNSTFRIHTDSSELLDIEDTGSNNRFNINRNVQQINLDFASKPTDLTTVVGAIRTAQDGTNLTEAIKFQENGQVTITERVKIESDSTVTTQTSAVIQATTTNSNLVLSPNGTGAIVASIPDGTATGGNARGSYAIDLQINRNNATQVASGTSSVVIGQKNIASLSYAVAIGDSNNASWISSVAIGQSNTSSASQSVAIGSSNTSSGTSSTVLGASNTASSNYSTVSGGQSNTASTNTHATVVGGYSNTASGDKSIAGGSSNTASGGYSFAICDRNSASGTSSVSIGSLTWAAGGNSLSTGKYSYAYLQDCIVGAGGRFSATGDAQWMITTLIGSGGLTSGATLELKTEPANMYALFPSGSNRAWNVTVKWVATVASITGTATGVSVGDIITQIQTTAYKIVSNTGSVVGSVNTISTNSNTSMSTASMTISAQIYLSNPYLQLLFTAPTFAGGGTVTCRVVAKVELTEVAW